MSKLDLLRAMFEYNEWANDVILDACGSISEEELRGKQTISHDSISTLLVHTLATQIYWLGRWRDELFAGMPVAEQGRALESLREAFAPSHAGLRKFVGGLTDEGLAKPTAMPEFSERMKGVDLPLWQVMLQIIEHGIHHRAEIQSALTGLGHPVQDLDYIIYEADRARA